MSAGISDGTTRRAWFLLLPGCEILDIAGPLQALFEATGMGARYLTQYCGLTPTVTTAQGLQLSGLVALPEVTRGDRIFIPGYHPITTRIPARLLAWLRQCHVDGAELCAVCTGAFLLGDAGLLNQRSCTTHWRRVPDLARRFPRARVVGDRLFVEDSGIVTSAGITAGIDMTLALLERDRGPLLAAEVAREMVVYMRRDGSQRQESTYLDFQTHLSPGIHRVQQYLVSHPVSRDSLGKLAQIGCMSERHLTRVFRRATGISIQEYRDRLRLERARMLLRDPRLTIDAIASRCGYANARQLRRVWAARLGGSPGNVRRRDGRIGTGRIARKRGRGRH